jgi:hypothetical protein
MDKITGTTTTYEVDWATLGQYVSAASSNTISPKQQAFNAAGQNIPTDHKPIIGTKQIHTK